MASSKTCICDIFNNLRTEIVSFDSVKERSTLNQFIIADENGRKDNVFIRKSPLSAAIVVNYLLRHNPLSTQISLDNFFEQINCQPVSKSALSQRRTRLHPDIFKYLNQRFMGECYKTLETKLERWHDWYLLSCDGSDFALPDTDAIADVFGRYKYGTNTGHTDESFPMAKAMMVSDILNGFTMCGRLCPYRTDERNALEQMLIELKDTAPINLQKAIFILDRGYVSLKLMRDFSQQGLKFVIRVPTGYDIIRKFIASGANDDTVEWMPSSNTSLGRDKNWINSGRKPLKLRLIKIKLDNGTIEVLATNLPAEQVNVNQMKELYFKRWAIEVDYLHYKHVYQIEAFSGGRPICVEQDFNAVILCHNMVCLLINSEKDTVEEKNRTRKIRYKTNVAILAGTFFAVFIEMMTLGRTDQSLSLLSEVATKCLTPVRYHRSFSRKRKKLKSSDRNHTRTNRKRVC